MSLAAYKGGDGGVGEDVDPSHVCKSNTDLGMHVTLNLSQKAVRGKGKLQKKFKRK